MEDKAAAEDAAPIAAAAAAPPAETAVPKDFLDVRLQSDGSGGRSEELAGEKRRTMQNANGRWSTRTEQRRIHLGDRHNSPRSGHGNSGSPIADVSRRRLEDATT